MSRSAFDYDDGGNCTFVVGNLNDRNNRKVDGANQCDSRDQEELNAVVFVEPEFNLMKTHTFVLSTHTMFINIGTWQTILGHTWAPPLPSP